MEVKLLRVTILLKMHNVGQLIIFFFCYCSLLYSSGVPKLILHDYKWMKNSVSFFFCFFFFFFTMNITDIAQTDEMLLGLIFTTFKPHLNQECAWYFGLFGYPDTLQSEFSNKHFSIHFSIHLAPLFPQQHWVIDSVEQKIVKCWNVTIDPQL